MQLPELLKRLRPEIIYFDSRFPCEGDSCDGLETFLYISINPILCPSEYEQALTVLHEMLHSLEEFDNKSTFANHDEKIEAEIDVMAKKILAEQPETFYFLVQQIQAQKNVLKKDGMIFVFTNGHSN